MNGRHESLDIALAIGFMAPLAAFFVLLLAAVFLIGFAIGKFAAVPLLGALSGVLR